MLQQACWLSCAPQQPFGTRAQIGSGEEGKKQPPILLHFRCYLRPLGVSHLCMGSDCTAGAGFTMTWALPSHAWCLVNVCRQHRLRQTHPSALWLLSGRQLPSYFYPFVCPHSLGSLTQVKKKTPPLHSMVILVLSQTTSLSSLSWCRQARTTGRTGGTRREQQQSGHLWGNKAAQAVPSCLQVISSAPDQQQTGYFIYLETWIDVSWGMCRRRGEVWDYLPLWLFLW